MSFKDRLKEARASKGYTQEQLAERIGIATSTLTGYEKGNREPDMAKLTKILDILDVNADFMFQDDLSNMTELVISLQEKNHIQAYRQLSQENKNTIDTLINALSERRTEHANEALNVYPPKVVSDYGYLASAGNGQFVFDDIPFETVEVPNDSKADFVIGVNGDSMEPTYHDRDKLLIKKQAGILPGRIGIFMIDGEAYVKELGHNELVSHNKKYKNIKLTPETKCVGMVIGKL